MLEKERARFVLAMTNRSPGIIWISFGDTPQLISRWFFRDAPFMMHSEGSRSRVESYCRGAGGSYNPKSSLHFLFLARGMKIGWSATPKQLCRLPVLVVVLSRRLLAFPSGFYIDDLQVVETLVSRGLSTGLLGFGDFPGSAHSTLVEITTVFTPVSDPRRLMWLPVFDSPWCPNGFFINTSRWGCSTARCAADSLKVSGVGTASAGVERVFSFACGVTPGCYRMFHGPSVSRAS